MGTWPQAILLHGVPPHQDPLFSIWRLAWIARAIPSPAGLFDANIYFPARGTLLYSDATLLQGVLAYPFISLGADPPVVYNVLVLGSFVASACAMYLLARDLTGSRAAAFLAGLVFGFAPFRFDHYIHLELLWGFWTPLSLWALHRALATGSVRYGVLTGAFAAMQLISCIYYGIFLSTVFAVLVPGLLLVPRFREPWRWKGLAAGALIAGVAAALYAVPYVRMAAVLGARGLPQVEEYSPKLHSFLASPSGNWVYGWTATRWGANEAHLFVGATACVLGMIGLAFSRQRWTWTYASLLALFVLIVLGANGPVYSWFYDWWPGYDGLRVPSRAGLVVVLAVALLAAAGLAVLLDRFESQRLRRAVAVLCCLGVAVEYYTRIGDLRPLDSRVPSVYEWLSRQDAVVLHLPTPAPNQLPGHEPLYQWQSTMHWRPLVNGYSGHYPSSYIRLLQALRRFPARGAMKALRERGVRYVIVHEQLLTPDEFGRLRLAMESSRYLRPVERFMGVGGEPLYVAEVIGR